MNGPERGSLLIESMLAGCFVAIAALGLSAAMVSGLKLGQRSNATLTRVATAENLVEELRASSLADFSGVVSQFGSTTTAELRSIGSTGNLTTNGLHVEIPLDENVVPGLVDLDGKPTKTVVDPTNARLLVFDVTGADGFRLCSAVPNFDLLKGVVTERASNNGGPVVFGEVRPPPDTQNSGSSGTTSAPDAATPNTVTVSASALVGNTAQFVLENSGSSDRKLVSMTITPDRDGLYFKNVRLNSTAIFTPPLDQPPGTVTVQITSTDTIAPGEATMTVGEFFIRDTSGHQILTAPGQVSVEFTFDDGSVTSTTVR